MGRSPAGRTTRVVTVDFHVTCECSQECPYCWGPQRIKAVGTATARAIIARVVDCGIRRIVFTGGDPLQRPDIGKLLHTARAAGLEVALSTTGDRLTARFLKKYGADIDLISLPLDGSTEEVNRRTKGAGHFAAVRRALDALARHPRIDVKLCTPVTTANLHDVPNIAALFDRWARRVRNRAFYNVFQTFPRAMKTVAWGDWLVSDHQFQALRQAVQARRWAMRVRFLSRRVLDRLYVMIFPDGTLVVPSGARYRSYGKFLELGDLDAVLAQSPFAAARHRRHAQGWQKAPPPVGRRSAAPGGVAR